MVGFAIAGLDSQRLFDRSYYLACNQDIASHSEVDPFQHYLYFGGWEGRNPHPLFDSSFYLDQNSHLLAGSKINPLIHFLTEGARQGCDPHVLFSTRFYLDQGLSMTECSYNPLLHYLEIGAKEGLNPHPLFDSSFYLRQLKRLERKEPICNPLAHYLTSGYRLGLQPSPRFDSKAYCKRYPDVSAAGVNPLLHYVTFGKAEGRKARELRGLKAGIARKFGLLKFINLRQSVEISGKTFEIPIMRGEGEDLIHVDTSFIYDILKLLEKFLPVEGFVDVGANVGQTLMELRSFSDHTRYIGFEPNPVAYSILEELNKTNNFQGQLLSYALSDRNTTTALFKTCPTDGAATITPEFRPSRYSGEDRHTVTSRRLDDVIGGIAPLKKHFVLKIDAEGAEYKILMGASRCIFELRPIIICEVLHALEAQTLSLSRINKADIQRFLGEHNYRIYQIELLSGEVYRENLKSLSPIEELPVDLYENAPTTCNFLFAPEELSGVIEACRA